MVVRPSLKRVVPGSVPPWRAPCFAWPRYGFGLPGIDFRALAVVFHFAIEAPLLRRSAVFLQALSHEKQTRSRRAVGVASEALRSRCFLTNVLCKTSASWFVFLEGQDPWLRAKKLLLLVRRLPLNAACQLLCRSPLAVAPVLRTLPPCGAPAALFFAPGLLSCAGREWKLALGSGSWVGGIDIETFDELCFEKI